MTPLNLKGPGQEEDAETEPEEDDEQDQAEDEQEDEENPKDEQKSVLIQAHRAVLADALGRMCRRLGAAARRAAKKPETFLASIDALHAEHGPVVASALGPAVGVARVLCDFPLTTRKVAEAFIEDFCRDLLRVAGESTAANLADPGLLARRGLDHTPSGRNGHHAGRIPARSMR